MLLRIPNEFLSIYFLGPLQRNPGACRPDEGQAMGKTRTRAAPGHALPAEPSASLPELAEVVPAITQEGSLGTAKHYWELLRIL